MALLGMQAVVYRNTGTYVSPTWVAISSVKDVTLQLEAATFDVSKRGNNGWRAEVATLKTATIEGNMIWLPGDAGFEALKDAFLANGSIELLVLDQPIATSGAQGLRATCMVTNFSRNEQLEEAITVDFTAKPTDAVNAPTWHEVA